MKITLKSKDEYVLVYFDEDLKIVLKVCPGSEAFDQEDYDIIEFDANEYQGLFIYVVDDDFIISSYSISSVMIENYRVSVNSVSCSRGMGTIYYNGQLKKYYPVYYDGYGD